MAIKPANSIRVEVVYALSDAVWSREVIVPPGASAAQAVQLSGLLDLHSDLRAELPPIGIYGRLCSPEQPLLDGDRVELYRPLVFDPMESRRRRFLHRQRKAEAGAGGPGQGTPRHAQKPGPA